MNVVFKIDGADFSDVLEEGGLQWEDNDLDEDGSGRDLAGYMNRHVVARKDKLKITTIPLTTARVSQLLTAVRKQTVSVTYVNPQLGTQVTQTMYNSSRLATTERQYGDDILWDSIEFSLIEV